jgi:hypothetical protein
VVGGEFFEVAGSVFAEVDLDAVANGVEHLEESIAVFACVAVGAVAEAGGDFLAPPLFDEFFELFFVADDDGGEGAVTHGGDVAFGGGGGEGPAEFGGEEFGLFFGEEGLAPIEDEGLLAEIVIGEGELDGLFGEVVVVGDDGVEGVGEAGFGHLGFAGDEGFQLHPADGGAFAFAFEEAEAAGVEEEARIVAVDLELFVLGLLGVCRSGGESSERRTARQRRHDVHCVIWTQGGRRGPHVKTFRHPPLDLFSMLCWNICVGYPLAGY